MNSSCDTTRPLLRLLGLISSVVLFACLWSGDQRIQQEIAAARAKCRPVYAGPSVIHVLPKAARNQYQALACQPPTAGLLGFLDRIPGGQYQLTDERGNIGTLVLHSRQGALPAYRPLTIHSSLGELRLTPIQMVSASTLISR